MFMYFCDFETFYDEVSQVYCHNYIIVLITVDSSIVAVKQSALFVEFHARLQNYPELVLG